MNKLGTLFVIAGVGMVSFIPLQFKHMPKPKYKLEYKHIFVIEQTPTHLECYNLKGELTYSGYDMSMLDKPICR
jgi:hypothetical protein